MNQSRGDTIIASLTAETIALRHIVLRVEVDRIFHVLARGRIVHEDTTRTTATSVGDNTTLTAKDLEIGQSGGHKSRKQS
jgi:hypothetical protein